MALDFAAMLKAERMKTRVNPAAQSGATPLLPHTDSRPQLSVAHRVKAAPPAVWHMADWVTADEEAALLRCTTAARLSAGRSYEAAASKTSAACLGHCLRASRPSCCPAGSAQCVTRSCAQASSRPTHPPTMCCSTSTSRNRASTLTATALCTRHASRSYLSGRPAASTLSLTTWRATCAPFTVAAAARCDRLFNL